MSSLKAYQLLINAANLYQEQRRGISSKEEIIRKINQIKYLSSLKEVPVIDIRKEIIHLQNKLVYISELEKKLDLQKRKEAIRVKSLKVEIVKLKKKLEITKEKELHKKVEKLVYLLGEILAKQGSKIDVELSKKVIEEIKKDRKIKVLPFVRIAKDELKCSKKALKKEFKEDDEINRIKILQEKLDQLKIELNSVIGSTDKIQMIQNQVNLIEIKLKIYYQKYPELEPRLFSYQPTEIKVDASKEFPVLSNGEVKHDVLFGVKEQKNNDEIHRLPLPPPPKRKKE